MPIFSRMTPSSRTTRPSILVCGSSNTDMVVKSPALPGPGETILGGTFFMFAGGKGANQAVAAARLGGNVTFIARTGQDIFGAQAIDGFEKEGIDCRYIGTDTSAASGVALITVDGAGENCIVVAPGANANLTPSEVQKARGAIETADIILAQLEVPLATVIELAACAAGSNRRFILNPAPACEIPDELLENVSILTPNEREAEYLTGVKVTGTTTALTAAQILFAKGVSTVIITLGKGGALLYEGREPALIPAPAVTAVDTTAAGDVFNGALAVALGEKMRMTDAVKFANHAAALSVTRLGAQTSAPHRQETESFIASKNSYVHR
ncbi:MAG TPA: ribokinase [Puia sp.]|nr:ribokinase [Puia sp.]